MSSSSSPFSSVIFVTGNAKKLEEARAILSSSIPNLQSRSVNLPELQGEALDISKEKARIAAKQIGGPVLVEDTSLCFNALNGLPGPYIKWFLEKVGHPGLNNLLSAYEDKSAYAQCVFAFCASPGSEPILFDGRCPGRIVPARGELYFGWDPIFEPEAQEEGHQEAGKRQTFAEMRKEFKNQISHRSKALAMVKEFFAKHPELVGGTATSEKKQ